MTLNKNKITSIVSLIFSLIVAILAFNIQTPPSATMDFLGPKGFPLIISSILILCSIGMFFIKDPLEEKSEIGLEEIKKLLPYLGILILFIILLPYMGMVLGIFLLMMVLIYFIERGNWKKNTVISASVAIGIWIIFAQILNISIPAWPSFFQ